MRAKPLIIDCYLTDFSITKLLVLFETLQYSLIYQGHLQYPYILNPLNKTTQRLFYIWMVIYQELDIKWRGLRPQ